MTLRSFVLLLSILATAACSSASSSEEAQTADELSVQPSRGAGTNDTDPGSNTEFLAWPEQHTSQKPAWGTSLKDIIRHLPLSYGSTYADSDLVTYGHETTHGINSHL